MNAFRFVLLSLTCFRLTRLVTTDEWPPSNWFREAVEKRFGEHSSWMTLVTCPWCWGVWTTGVVYAVDHFIWTIPTILLAAGATMALVGLLGTYDERP